MNADWAAWTAVAALLLILWERFSRRFTWWALCRTLPYLADECQRDIFQPMGRAKGRWLWFLSLLWPRQHRVFANELVAQYLGFEQIIAPLPFDTEPVFLEARLYAKKRHDKRQRRLAVRAHRDGYFKQRIKCANGCGTSYGDTLAGFSSSRLLNSWTCVSHKCSLREPHYCGRCDLELRGFFEDDSKKVGELVASTS